MQAERPHQHTPGVAGCSRNSSSNTHTHGTHPSQEWRGASGAPTPAHARSGGVQPKSRAQTHTPTARTQARIGGVQAEHPHQHTHSPTPQPGVARRSRNSSPNTYTHGAHPSQEWRGASRAPTPAHARSGGCSRNPSPNTHTHGAHPSQEWRGASGASTPAHARSGGVQPKPEPKHTHPWRAPQPGVAGCKRSVHTSTRQEWRGAAETRAQTHTPTARTPARSGGVQAERPHQHTPGVAGCSRNPSPNTHTPGAHPSQEWRGASRAPTPIHTHSNTLARIGGVQCKPEPKHTHQRRATKPGVAECKRSAHTSTHTAQHPSQEWRGAAETRAQTHTPTARTPARSGGVQAERQHQHTHSPTPEPGVAGCSRNPSPNTHTPTAHPSQAWRGTRGARTQTRTPQHPCQKWRGAAETRAQTHTPTPRMPARSGGVQAERAHEHTHSPTAQPGVAGRSRNPSPSTHNQAAHPSQERRGTRGARTPAHTQPNTPARSGGAQPKPEPKHTHPHRTPQPGVAGYQGSTHTSTHTPQHPSQEWRGAAKTRAQTDTPMARTPARSGGLQAERPHQHTPGVAGWSRNPSPSTQTHGAHPSQEWRAASGARTPAHARSGGLQPKPEPKHTHPRRAPQPGVAGCKPSAHTSTRQE